jgi:SAM-dependent methyltransferase
MSYNNNFQHWITQKSKIHPAHDWIEKPAMQKLLPDLKSKRILCLGCGSGEETQFLKELGAEYILGIDSSFELIEFAKDNYESKNKVEFSCHKIEDLSYQILGGHHKFDLIYSSLAMHYVDDWTKILKSLKPVMKKNAVMLFSAHHPVKWGAQSTKSKDQNSFLLGYTKSKTDSKNYKVYGDYLKPRKVNYELFNKIPIEFYHKSISTMFSQIQSAGFEVLEFVEPLPVDDSRSKPDFYEVYSRIPLFVIWKIGIK